MSEGSLGPHADVGETAILRIGDTMIEEASPAFVVGAAERNVYLLSRKAFLSALWPAGPRSMRAWGGIDGGSTSG
jgi:hypothetical protein